jgi:DNA-nicking Smr family endonuclease
MGHPKKKKPVAKARKTSGPKDAFKPLGHLEEMLREKAISLPADAPEKRGRVYFQPVIEGGDDDALFRNAMADVIPLPRKGRMNVKPKRRKSADGCDTGDVETLNRLKNLVERGKGFVVADTSEYIEGARYCDNPEVAKRLHRGDFSIQSHIDLHGLITAEAREALDVFISEAIAGGKRAVLVVHGRGLSSPGKPVLKALVQEWLTRGPRRKWVIAFSSARPCDGGAGATYVLLRRGPYTRRFRKKGSGPAS